jgi:uncharacterized protein (TIGR03437 family)
MGQGLLEAPTFEEVSFMVRFLALVSFICTVSLQAWAELKIVTVVNSASYQEGMPTGGALASILCTGLTGEPGIVNAPSSSPLPFELAGITVSVNGAPSPIFSVFIPPAGASTLGQINIQVPLERNTTLRSEGVDAGGYLGVVQKGGFAILTKLPVSGLGGFLSDGSGYLVAQHASESTPVTLDNPAHPGEAIIAFANDFFAVWPPPPIGFPAPDQPVFQIFASKSRPFYAFDDSYLYLQEYPEIIPPGVTGFPSGSFTHTPALEITFRGLAPGQIGVEQIVFVVPNNQQPGDWALFFNNGSCPDGSGPCQSHGASSAYAKLPVR